MEFYGILEFVEFYLKKKKKIRFKVKDEVYVLNLVVDFSILIEFFIENKDILCKYFFFKIMLLNFIV